MDRLAELRSEGNLEKVLRPHIQKEDRGKPELKNGYYGYYSALAREVRPNVIVEFGVRFGYSAIAMLHGQGGTAQYHGVDFEYWQGSNTIAARAIRKHTKGLVAVHRADTGDVRLRDILPKADLIHVDGNHRNPDREIANAVHLLAPGGVIVFDDTNWAAVTRGIEAADLPDGYKSYDIDTFTGWRVLSWREKND